MSSSTNEHRTPPSQRGPLQPVPNTESDRPRFWLPTVIPGNCKRKLTWGPEKYTPPLTRSGKRIKELEDALAQKEKENESLKKMVDEQLEEIGQLGEKTNWIVDELHEWIDRSLKCKFLVDKINEIAPGDPNTPTAKELFKSFDDIVIPEVSDEIWKNSIPTRLKEWPEEEWEELPEELPEELTEGESDSEIEEDHAWLHDVEGLMDEHSQRLLDTAAEREGLRVCEVCSNIIEGDVPCEICPQSETITLGSITDSLDFGPFPDDEVLTDLEERYRDLVEVPAVVVIQRSIRRYLRNRT